MGTDDRDMNRRHRVLVLGGETGQPSIALRMAMLRRLSEAPVPLPLAPHSARADNDNGRGGLR